MTNVLPNIFKGIALFTPGGDVIYGIDPQKRTQWHSDLCVGMRQIWDLKDSPHFLVPGYTATVERWLNPQTEQIETIAEVHPPVERYIPLLQALFNVDMATQWHVIPWQEEYCNRAIIETYRPHFPELWETKNLIVRLDPQPISSIELSPKPAIDLSATEFADLQVPVRDHEISYTLCLFIQGDHASTEETLNNIHQLLEQGLNSPYTLKVIDISKDPQQAAINRITITPTLVRVVPKPTRRIVGQLNDIQRVLNILTCF